MTDTIKHMWNQIGRRPAIQQFEGYPDLAREIERMASTGTTGSLHDWQRFTDALNAALKASATRNIGERIRRGFDAAYLELLDSEQRKITAILGTEFMDPPGGGDVSVSEQVRRAHVELQHTRLAIAQAMDCILSMENSRKDALDKIKGAPALIPQQGETET